MKTTKVVLMGIGPLGQKIAGYISERDNPEIVGAIDMDPAKTGKTLKEVCPLIENSKSGSVIISADVRQVMEQGKPDVVLLATVSSLERLLPQIESLAGYGAHIVSTCEELSYPWLTQPGISEKIDKLARDNNIAILGTGINPGFLMDYLPVALTGVCQKVESIAVSRVQDATTRRVPFQKKIGAGLTIEEFDRKKAEGTLRHVGLTESMHMIAARLGWSFDRTEDVITPILAENPEQMGDFIIQPGMCRGVQQIGRLFDGDKELIRLTFKAAIGMANPADTIEIKGNPNILQTIPGCVNGDVGTSAIVINAVRSIIAAQPGLRTMLDIPVVSFS